MRASEILELLHVKDETFEVFAFWVVDVDGVISGLMELVKNTHVAAALGGCCEDRKTELVLIDGLTAAEGKDDASRTYLLESDGIEACVALEGVAESIFVLCEGGRVKDYEIVVAAGTLEVLEGIFTVAFMSCFGEVKGNISISELDSACAGIDAMNVIGTSTKCIDTEATSVTEHIEDILSIGVGFEEGSVVTLINEETSLLTFEPVDVELHTILKGDIYVAVPH